MAFDPLGVKKELDETNDQAQQLLATLSRLAKENAPKVEEILTNLASLTAHLSAVAARLNAAPK